MDVVIKHADRLAKTFFLHDPSSAHRESYDTWVLSGHSPAHRLVTNDVHAINRTMAARSPLASWTQFTSASNDLPELAAVDSYWDLFTMNDHEWRQLRCRERIAALLEAIMGPYRNLAVTTKVLHAKRPRLIPVCDSYVVQMLGGSPEPGPDKAASIIAHLRDQGRANLEVLQAIQRYLASLGIQRTLVRIMDALIWVSHPGAWGSNTYKHLNQITVGVSVDSAAS
nr:DUF6308 family protein [Nitrolancea hollandica]